MQGHQTQTEKRRQNRHAPKCSDVIVGLDDSDFFSITIFIGGEQRRWAGQVGAQSGQSPGVGSSIHFAGPAEFMLFIEAMGNAGLSDQTCTRSIPLANRRQRQAAPGLSRRLRRGGEGCSGGRPRDRQHAECERQIQQLGRTSIRASRSRGGLVLSIILEAFAACLGEL